METFKRDFQSLMRRFYVLLPRSLAGIVIASVVENLFDYDYISRSEYDYLIRLNKAYSDLLAGDFDDP